VSAGTGSPRATPKVQRDLRVLAPRFRDAVEKALKECHTAGLDAIVFEAYRTEELQALYYKRGRTIKPPRTPVTWAKSSLQSWHGFGLAVDVISQKHLWNPPAGWWEKVAVIFKKHGCKWGGDWKKRDMPHFQWSRCKPSPSDRARELFAEGGLTRVWKEVGAA
jgi:peptidoglycan L-alanyl-D-glutamate endopeptidase CwlK